jgi:hypothetical protein
VVPKAMLSKPLKKKDATWVKPTVKVEVEHRDITNAGPLRHAS